MAKDIQLVQFNKKDTAVFSFDPNKPLIGKGKENLVQKIIKLLFTLQESNVYDPEYGSTFLNLLNSSSPERADSIESAIPIIIDNIKEQIVQSQAQRIARGNVILESEKLKDLRVREAIFDEVFGGWMIKLEIITNLEEITVTIP